MTPYHNLVTIKSHNSPALVLSGGGTKAAAFHIGVCLAMQQRGFAFGNLTSSLANKPGIRFKTFVGSSAGSIVASFLASGYSLEDIIYAFTLGSGLTELMPHSKLNQEEHHLPPMGYRDLFSVPIKEALPRWFLPDFFSNKLGITGGLEVLIKRGVKVNGLFSTQNLEKYFREKALKTNNFNDLETRLFIIATYLDYPKKAIFGPKIDKTFKGDKNADYISNVSISEAIASSSALPAVFAPYGIKLNKSQEGEEETTYFFDGEIRDTMSTHVATEQGADLIIASYSMSPYALNTEMGSLNQYGIPMIINQAIYQVIHQKVEQYQEAQRTMRSIIEILNAHFKEHSIPAKKQSELINKIVDSTKINLDAQYLYIHPSPQDHEMFFADHLSLNSKNLEKIANVGYKAAMNKLRTLKL